MARAERNAAIVERLEAELLEQARLLGMSGEREVGLRGEIERLKRENKRLRRTAGEPDAVEQNDPVDYRDYLTEADKDALREQLQRGNAEAKEAAKARGYKRHPKLEQNAPEK